MNTRSQTQRRLLLAQEGLNISDSIERDDDGNVGSRDAASPTLGDQPAGVHNLPGTNTAAGAAPSVTQVAADASSGPPPDGAALSTAVPPDMATGNINSLFKPPTFAGGKTRDSARAITFLKDIEVYFEVVDFYHPADADLAWRRRSAGLRINCFPENSYARTWFAQVQSTLASYAAFEDAFRTHFISAGADLVSVQSQWSNAKQRSGDTVASYYQHLMVLENLLGQLGHTVSENEAITRFVDGLKDSLRIRLVEKRVENASLTRQALVNLAVTFETAQRVTRAPAAAASAAAAPQLRALQGSSVRRYWFCKKVGHTADTCRKIAARKATGTWEDRPRRS